MSSIKKKIAWPVLLYIGGYHLFLLIGLPIYFMYASPPLSMILTMFALVFASGIAITAGYHRLYSHSTYKAHPAVEAVLLFFGSLATQGSVLRWACDHRLHHAFVDHDRDPYTVKDGFWHAHILWLFKRTKSIDPKVIADLWRNRWLRFQNDHYVACMLVSNLIVFVAAGWFFNDFLGAFFFIWMLRMFLLHHTTWCINSLAHYWGSQSYSREHSAVDNYLISLLTYGEGYHNYHHTFANDYRNGIRWYHFDPAKWLIWTLHKLGLAYNLKRVSNYRIANELLVQHRNELLQKLSSSFHQQKEYLAAKVTEIQENLSAKLLQFEQLLLERAARRNPDPLLEKASAAPKNELMAQIRLAKIEIKNEWRRWKTILKMISKTKIAV